ncbi:hypothetical protein JW890_01315 [candidate division WOR-3 bacterium]|nr:hypothetical protein [candidate division WOR-3 bacterium]
MCFIPALFFASLLKGATLNVPLDYSTIQNAIDASVDYDTVLVDNGKYYENIRFFGKKITVASRYILSGEKSDILGTIIDGSMPLYADTASCVRFIDHEDTNSVLCGFTLTGGKGTVWPDVHNANLLYREGGGIFIDSGSPVIKANLIVGNETSLSSGLQSAGGGGIRIADASPIITGNVILLNKGRYGGGISEYHSNSVIKNNLIMCNEGGEDFGGGGVWVWGASGDTTLLENNTIVGNTSFQRGGGIRIIGSKAVVSNCVLWDNVSYSGGNPQIYTSSGGIVLVRYSCVEGGYSGAGNISGNPCFSDTNKHLSPSSPCIDSGDPLTPGDPEDPYNPGQALFPSMGFLRADIGAYGGGERIDLPDITYYVGVEETPNDEGAGTLTIHSLVSIGTKIEFRLSVRERCFVSVKIYSLDGSLKDALCGKTLDPGDYIFCLDPGSYYSGVYFLAVENERMVVLNKLVVVR